jgi:hypothetical protein
LFLRVSHWTRTAPARGAEARHFATIGYEVLTSLESRYARVYQGCETADGLVLLFRPRIKRLLTGFAELVVLLVETLTDTTTAPLDIRTVFFNIGLARFAHRASLILRESCCREANDTCDNSDRESEHETSRYDR